jgi:hypothetical protein
MDYCLAPWAGIRDIPGYTPPLSPDLVR